MGRNLEGAGSGWVEPEMGRGPGRADSVWQPPAGSPPWVGCQSRPAGFPENSFPMSSAALVGHPTHGREPLRSPGTFTLPCLGFPLVPLTHTRKPTLRVLGSHELRWCLHFPSPHTLTEVSTSSRLWVTSYTLPGEQSGPQSEDWTTSCGSSNTDEGDPGLGLPASHRRQPRPHHPQTGPS